MRSKHMKYAQSEIANSVRTALGGLLRQRRDEAERSLVEVAASAGLSAAYLSEVERGLKDISTEKLIALSTALELSAADLYLNLARQLGSRAPMQQQRSWPDDPRMQLRLATASLRPHALRSVADCSGYLAATQATRARRRSGRAARGWRPAPHGCWRPAVQPPSACRCPTARSCRSGHAVASRGRTRPTWRSTRARSCVCERSWAASTSSTRGAPRSRS